MGKAASSCLKIMACGGRSTSDEDAAAMPDEAKSPQDKDKAKWNFLLRSSRNQVSSNIAVSGPLASVPEKDEDSEASNKSCSPQPEQVGGKVRMMKFAEFVPKLSFHLTDTESLDSVSVQDGATDSIADPSHQKSKSSEQLPVVNNADDSDNNTSKESEASATACDAPTETDRPAKVSVAVGKDAEDSLSSLHNSGPSTPTCDFAKVSVAVGKDAEDSFPSLHNSDPSTPTCDSAFVDQSLLRESSAIKIQAALRAHLAELALKRQKNIVKLQAAARGYLVRREAVGTLRCVQAVLKMQALVRARRMHQHAGKLDKKEPLEALVQEVEGLDCLGKDNCLSGSNALCLSNEKLLKNRFILQLLECTPRSKRIYISCEPSQSDSAWKWLERWMTVISSDSMLQQETNQSVRDHNTPEEFVASYCLEESPDVSAVVHFPEIPMSSHPEPNNTEKDNAGGASAPECHDAASTPELVHEAEEYLRDRDASDEAPDASRSHNTDEFDTGNIEAQPCGMVFEPTDETSEHVFELSNHTDETTVCPELSMPEVIDCISQSNEPKIVGSAAEQVEVKFVPVGETPGLSVTSHLEAPNGQEPILNTHNSFPHNEAQNLDMENTNPLPEPMLHASSESDSEISMSSSSSSSGSPDNSESESEGVACELGIREEEKHDTNKLSTDFGNHENENHEKDASPKAISKEPIKHVDEDVGLSSYSSNECAKPSELSTEPTASDVQDTQNDNLGLHYLAEKLANSSMSTEQTTPDVLELHENGDSQQAYSSSPERSPSCHKLETGLFETPPSQIFTTKAENVNTGHSIANEKQTSERKSKRSLSETRNASDVKSDQQHVADSRKRRLSTGTAAQPDNGASKSSGSGNNSLPSYMQDTESARAKVHASVSPKTSPDVKDSSRKKRVSPSAGAWGEKHNSSPRMQRSGSQVHQTPKVNGVHAPLNFSERRWQR